MFELTGPVTARSSETAYAHLTVEVGLSSRSLPDNARVVHVPVGDPRGGGDPQWSGCPIVVTGCSLGPMSLGANVTEQLKRH